MERSKEVELLSECLVLAQEKKPFMERDEALIPVSKYIDEARFGRERELLFRQQPNVVAHVSQLANPGDFVTREIAATPVLVARGTDGGLNAFVNVCRHRGATVELRDAGRCKRFVCPYHAWTYGLDGRLDKVRHQEGFPSLEVADTSLVRLPVFESAGFVWVVADPSVDGDLAARLPPSLLNELVGLGCEDLEVFESNARVWKTNWKLIADGGLESYHFKIAHRKTIAGGFLDNGSTFEFFGDHIRTVLPRTSLLDLAEQPRSEWNIRKHTHLLYSLFPNASLLVQEDHVVMILVTPLAVDATRIEITTLVPTDIERTDKVLNYWKANHAFTGTTLDEDFEIAEQIQRGAPTGANEHFRFARFEAALTRWHEGMDHKLQLKNAGLSDPR